MVESAKAAKAAALAAQEAPHYIDLAKAAVKTAVEVLWV